MRFFNNGTPADSFSPLTAAGTTGYAEVSEPFHMDFYARLGGALYLSMGVWLQYDSAEPKRASGGNGTAGAAKAANGLDGNGRPDCFGRQVVIADVEDTSSTTLYAAYSYFAGVFTGHVGTSGGGYGYNMPKNTITASDDAAPTNGFTFLGASTTPCIDPLNGGRSYAKPGDIIAVRRFGPAVAWVSSSNSTIAGSGIGFSGAFATGGDDSPPDGVATLAPIGSRIGVTVSAPAAFATAGTEQGCKVIITH